MQEVSATYTSLLSSTHSVESKLEVWDKDGTNLVHTFNEQEISSMSTTRGLFTNDTPSVGGTVSCEIDCELYIGDVEIPRMAMLKPYIRLMSLLHQWQKWSIASTYHWKKYAVDVNYTDRIIGNTGTKNYSHVGTPETMVINSTPQIVVIDGEPKYDFSSGRQTVVQTDYTPVGSFCAANTDSIKTASGGVGDYQTYYAKVLSIKDNSVFGWIASSDANSEIHDIQTTRSRGTYIEDVSSTNQSSYPQNGEQGGYWYVYDGYTQERGSYIENVSSDNQSAYPQNGIQDGYWYVSIGRPVSDWRPKGVYWIDTRSTDYSSGKMTIHGYDAMLKGEVIFANETTVEDWPRTDLQVVNGYYDVTTLVHNGIAQKLGVTIQQETLDFINKGYEIQFPGTVQTEEESGQQVDKNVKGAAYTIREVLSYIGSMYCGNWTIDEDGTLRLVRLNIGSHTLTNLLSPANMTISGATLSEGVFTYPAGVFCMINQPLPVPVAGHKYYGRVDQRVPVGTTFGDGRFEYFGGDGTGKNIVFASFMLATMDNEWHTYSDIQSFPYISGENWTLRSFTVSGSNTVYRQKHMIIDLTEAFGAGNEPSKDWCDKNIPYFEGTIGTIA